MSSFQLNLDPWKSGRGEGGEIWGWPSRMRVSEVGLYWIGEDYCCGEMAGEMERVGNPRWGSYLPYPALGTWESH